MTLDFTPLQRAISQLTKSLEYSNSPMAKADPDLFEQLRNSVIQCYEFTYELSHKMLRRFLAEASASPEHIKRMPFADLIRTGNQMNLLRSDWMRWKEYRQARTSSSHAYDEEKAKAVYSIAGDFLDEAVYLYEQLKSQADAHDVQ